MPVPVSYPGVYVEEIPSGVRTITGVATSITAFVGRARKGPLNEAVVITSFADFERRFGGIHADYPMAYSVRDFYQNGGSLGVIVRVAHLAGAPDALNAVFAVQNEIGGTADPAAAKTKAAELKKKFDEDANASPAERDAVTAVHDAVVAAADAEGANIESVKKAIGKTLSTIIPRRAGISLPTGNGDEAVGIEAASEGAWANKLRARVDTDGIDAIVAQRYGVDEATLFNLTVQDGETGSQERFLSLTSDPRSARHIRRVLETDSSLVRVAGDAPANPPLASDKHMDKIIDAIIDKEVDDDAGIPADQKAAEKAKRKDAARKVQPFSAGDRFRSVRVTVPGWDGGSLTENDLTEGPGLRDTKRGLFALAKVDLFNLLCLPPDVRDGDTDPAVYQAALRFCVERRAMLIVDSPADWSANKDTAAAKAKSGLPDLNLTGQEARNAALFFPRVRQRDPMRDGQPDTFVPCGIVAGVMARTDATRGVWKAPAGLDAALAGILGLEVDLNDLENGLLNPLGINCLRNFAIAGRVVWGSRTLRGADLLADEYKYIPVRRLALFIEESLYRGTQWVVFEPNDEPLWAQIRLNVGAFMHNLFRQGAFQGRTPREAYFVKCDKETTTQNDINLGIVNIVVGFAPLKPAEFVIIKVQQIAGQIEV